MSCESVRGLLGDREEHLGDMGMRVVEHWQGAYGRCHGCAGGGEDQGIGFQILHEEGGAALGDQHRVDVVAV